LLVGNDVVDLRDPETRPAAIHRRFDERAFTPAERVRLTASETAHRVRWRMWAAKESAFKVARKLDPGTRFLPRAFSVQLGEDARAVVRHAMGRFEVSFSWTDDWVHAIATPSDSAEIPGPGGPHAGRGVEALLERARWGRTATAQVSARVRSMARSAIGSVLSISPFEIEIVTAGGVPVATWRESPLPIDLSLSHHGRFLACVWTRSSRA
jgi:phosphopantetheinyl transferase (holo-ACP synthase)